MMKTLFLQPPSFGGFDGGAGSRFQVKREIKSFWFPTWLAQPAALVPGSRLIDAPPAGIGMEPVLAAATTVLTSWFAEHQPGIAREDVAEGVDALVRLVVSHIVLPSSASDVTAERLARLALRYLGPTDPPGPAGTPGPRPSASRA